jgi:hypothetical protein
LREELEQNSEVVGGPRKEKNGAWVFKANDELSNLFNSKIKINYIKARRFN